VLENAPRYIRDSLVFPYDEGPNFITELARSQPGSFKAVNDALADPPQSTEQILHPEKYLADKRDQPITVTLQPLTDTLGAGWTLTDTDTLGEFDLKEMMEINGVDDSAAWEGWGGAGYDMYSKGNDALLLMQSKWDTDKDAVEFDSALNESMTGKYKIIDTKDGMLRSDDRRTFGIKRSGDMVTLVSGTDQAAVQRVMAAIK
jgi:hypothetical protein